ncbi:HEAT repeat domain-containing protein [Dactylosporangium vinaceum]|uniref:NACHT domain-containing protein n=1 Tax=Dactylosporangium vinaceum TaxID=53362 RepID=A0ABV5MJ27_9ACTN|nr:NACHT domain-containing protein [Dactylosporangium vinaceum]UAB93682.1 HEAT repeat domain-containing protein [Dactylosporangium vinaceum]
MSDPSTGGREALAARLHAATVRLSVGPATGTGFFVTDQLLVSCAHLLPAAAQIGAEVSIHVGGRTCTGVIRELLRGAPKSEYPDLICIDVGDPIPDVSWAFLGPGATAGDEVYAYGFPKAYADGDSFYGRIEGIAGVGTGRELLKFQQTRVSEGVSGSPLLNIRTGAICGMIQSAFNRGEGGRALGSDKIFELLPDVAAWQAARAGQNQRWLRELSDEQLGSGAWSRAIVQAVRPAHDPFAEYCRHLIDAADHHVTEYVVPNGEPIALSSTASPELLRQPVPEALANWKPSIFSMNVQSTAFGRTEPTRFLTLQSALELYHWRMLLLGEPGSGKTFSLRLLAREAARQYLQNPAAPLPLYVAARLWRQDTDRDLAGWIARTTGVERSAVAAALTDGRAFLLLDGLDELESHAAEVAQTRDDSPTSLLNELSKLHNCRVVLSCRRIEYEKIADAVSFRLPFLGAATLDRLTPEQIEEYIGHIPGFLEVLRVDSSLLSLAANPLLLALLAHTYLLDPTRFAEWKERAPSEDGVHAVFRQYVETRFNWEAERPTFDIPVTLDEFYEGLGLALLRSRSIDDPSGDWILDRDTVVAVLGDRAAAVIALAQQMGLLSPSRFRALSKIRFTFRHALLRDHFAYPAAQTALQSADEADLQTAVLALSRLGGTEARDRLIEIARDETRGKLMRASAIEAVGALRDPDTYSWLREYLRGEDQEVSFAAAEAWQRVGGRIAADELAAFIEERDAGNGKPESFAVLASAIQLCRLTADNSYARQRYLGFLRQPDHWIASFARFATVSEPEEVAEAAEIYRARLPDAATPLKVLLLAGLATIEGEGALDVLLANLGHADQSVQGIIRWELNRFGETVLEELDRRARAAATAELPPLLKAIGYVRKESAAKLVASFIDPTNENVMGACFFALSQMGSKADSVLRDLLDQHEDANVRRAAACILAIHSREGFAEVLRRVVADAAEMDGPIAHGLSDSLLITGYDTARMATMFDLVDDQATSDGSKLIELTTSLGDIRVWPALERLAASPDESKQQAATAAMTRLISTYRARLLTHHIKGTIEGSDVAAAARILDQFSPLPLSELVRYFLESVEQQDLQLGFAAIAAILHSGRDNLQQIVDEIAERGTRDADRTMLMSAVILLVGGGSSARLLAELFDEVPVPIQEEMSEIVGRLSNPEIVSSFEQIDNQRRNARYGTILALIGSLPVPRQAGGQYDASPPDGDIASKLGQSEPFGHSEEVESAIIALLRSKARKNSSEFALRWLATRRSKEARAALIRMLRPPSDVRHLAALGLGLAGGPGEVPSLIAYAKRADAVGRVCAVWAMTATMGSRRYADFARLAISSRADQPPLKPKSEPRRAKRRRAR